MREKRRDGHGAPRCEVNDAPAPTAPPTACSTREPRCTLPQRPSFAAILFYAHFATRFRPPDMIGRIGHCAGCMNSLSSARPPALCSTVLIGASIVFVQTFICVGPLFAALFACTEGPGITIITDSPTQLSQCRLLSENSSAGREERAHRPASPPEPALAPATPIEAPPLVPPQKEQVVRQANISVPLERLGSLFVVTIQINEARSARLILDTGASHTILSRAIARDLGLFSLRPVASVTMHTVGGSVQADMVQVDSIRIAGAEVRNSLAVIHDLPDTPPGIDGLLGLSVLREFEVTLDTARSRLHLGRPQP